MEQEKLDEAIINLMKYNPMTAQILPKFFTFAAKDDCDTAYLAWDKSSNRFLVAVSNKLLKSLNTHAITAVLLHEISHAFLLYLVRAKGKNRRKMNIAADLIINETNPYIKRHLKTVFPNAVWASTVPLKSGAVLPSKISEWTTELIYGMIEDDKNFDGFDEHRECEGEEELEGEAEELSRKLGGGQWGSGGEFEGVLRIMRRWERDQRTINRILRQFSTTFHKKTPTKTSSWLRKNRKLPNLPIPGKRPYNKVPHVLIGVDMSGSMYDFKTLIERFISSLPRLNATFDVVMGDTAEKVFQSYKTLEKNNFTLPDVQNAWGGTKLQFILERYDKGSYDGILVFTDGILEWPEFPKEKSIIILTEKTNTPFKKTVIMEK